MPPDSGCRGGIAWPSEILHRGRQAGFYDLNRHRARPILALVVADCVEFVERESHGPYRRLEGSSLHLIQRRVIAGAVDGLELHDVAGPEEDHEVPEVRHLLLGIVDRHRRDAEHLIAAGAAHGIDAAKTTAVADRQFRRIGARAQIFWGLDLPWPLDHLVHEGQAGDEADHRDEPRRAECASTKVSTPGNC